MTSTTDTLAPAPSASAPSASEVRRATGIAAIAIPLWAASSLLTSLLGGIPPFQLVASTFTLAFLTGTLAGLARGRDVIGPLRQPWPVWLVGVVGLFGYHFFYFLAFGIADGATVEVNLLNYLWPLFIVLFSTLLPGERLKPGHVLGALCGLAGTALIITGRGEGVSLTANHLPAYAAVVTAAVIWGAYSVLSRRFGSVPTEAVGGFCLVTALLALLCHLAFETTVMPHGIAWPALVALGIGPFGLSFFLWDHGMKRGDIRALGVMSYAVPPASTLLLILFGQATGGWTVWTACALIAGGALLASWDLIRGK